MKFEWDPAKAAANIAKHGVSFEQAEAAFTDPKAMELLDEIRKAKNVGDFSDARSRES